MSGGNRRDVKVHLGEHTIRIVPLRMYVVYERIGKIVDKKSQSRILPLITIKVMEVQKMNPKVEDYMDSTCVASTGANGIVMQLV